MSNKIYPWLDEPWQQLAHALQQNTLPHALLLTGIAGLGKAAFAQQLAQSVLCKDPIKTSQACGRCKSCLLFQYENHPDFQVIQREEKRQDISVDQIRHYVQNAYYSSGQSGYSVLIIQDAENMNLSAANSLLKTLEEPTPHSLIILVSNAAEKLLPTIKSRCQHHKLKAPQQQQQGVAWLKQQGIHESVDALLRQTQGAPLTALALAQSDKLAQQAEWFKHFIDLVHNKADPIKLATDWVKLELNELLNYLSAWVMDLIKLTSTQQVAFLIHQDKLTAYQQLSKKIPIKHLFLLLDEIYTVKTHLNSSLNKQMLLENLLFKLIQH